MQDEPTKWYCQYCGGYRILTKDHFYPRSYLRYLAQHDPLRYEVILRDNTVMACHNCQRKKRDLHPERWLEVMVNVQGRKFVVEKIRRLRTAYADAIVAGEQPRNHWRPALNRTQKKALRSYDPVQALHRAMRSHQWQIWKLAKGGVYKGERKKSWWFAELYCQCGVRKFFIRDSTGRLISSARYSYPAEYSLADLDLSVQEINEMLWLIVFERELASETVGQLEEIVHERKASE